MLTFAPSCIKRRVTASPIPEAPPVIKTTLSFKAMPIVSTPSNISQT
ncbi:Uncharacterised protein [Chlamydia trachomatis]|nr:Uncharacterised protein [Chlamydia trachomatis]